MPIYKCELCNIKTKQKNDYNRHLNTKKHLKNIDLLIGNDTIYNYGLLKSINDHKMNTDEHKMNTNEHKMNTNDHKMNTDEHKMNTLHKCEYCDIIFNTKPSLRRHEIHYCENPNIDYKQLYKKSEKDIKNLEIQRKEWQKEKAELYKKIEQLIDKVGDSTTINANIILNSYGHEDMSHITEHFKTQLLKIPHMMIPKLIEAVHFSDKKPQNKNIALTNKKENKIKIFSGDKWIYKDKDETINDLVDGKYFILDTHYDEIEKQMSISTQTTYKEFRTFFDDSDKELVDKLKHECEMVLLNNR